ncbi:MAG: hypothetical protein MZU79_01465 [Anaerotruncus sp.]|nr:hypothetical protein [Anaerotruncus sp.]
MVPIIIGSFAGLLGGSFILESVYAIPGVGRITLQALVAGGYGLQRDPGVDPPSTARSGCQPS